MDQLGRVLLTVIEGWCKSRDGQEHEGVNDHGAMERNHNDTAGVFAINTNPLYQGGLYYTVIMITYSVDYKTGRPSI